MSSNAAAARTASITLLAGLTLLGLAGCKADAAVHSLAMAADAWREMPNAMWALAHGLRKPAAPTPACDSTAGS